MKIKAENAWYYREVFLVVKRRGNAIFKIRPLGYCREDRPKRENEVYASIRTRLTGQDEIELEPYLEV